MGGARRPEALGGGGQVPKGSTVVGSTQGRRDLVHTHEAVRLELPCRWREADRKAPRSMWPANSLGQAALSEGSSHTPCGEGPSIAGSSWGAVLWGPGWWQETVLQNWALDSNGVTDPGLLESGCGP